MSNVLGIDVGKAEIMVALLVGNKCVGKESFVNNDKGFKSLTKWLKQKKISTLKVCMEATGNYSNNIAEFLYDNGHEVHVVNPVCIKSFAKSKLIRTKIDAVDALIIAQYANITELIPYQPKSAAFKELKALHRCLDDLKGQCVQISNHLEHKEHVPKSVTSTWKKLLKDFKNEIKNIENSLDELAMSCLLNFKNWYFYSSKKSVLCVVASSSVELSPSPIFFKPISFIISNAFFRSSSGTS